MAKPNPRAAQREQQEPQEMHRPLPVPMKILMLVMTVWGAGYFLTVGTWPPVRSLSVAT